MKPLRYLALIVVLAGLAILSLVHRGATNPKALAQGAQDNTAAKPTKPTYLPIPGGDYRMDVAHSTIGFSIRHNELALVSGRFKDFTGTISYDDKDATKSSVEFKAKVESIDTGVEARDRHLRTADFFEVEKFPEMTFKSTRVERKGKNLLLHGDLTLKGITKPVTLPFTLTGAIKDGRGNTRIGIAAQTKIDRRDFGITWGRALPGGGFDVAHDVMIDLQLEAIQPAPKPAASPSPSM
ncbi:MAG: YceI family protein [Acidobacteriota bacterium]